MTLSNIPAPVRPTDDDAVIAVLSQQAKAAERNVNDPNLWIYVGNQGHATNSDLTDQPWAPPFLNGFSNVGAPRVLLRYRFLRPYDPDTTQNAIQLQGSVTGGTLGLPIFKLVAPQWFPQDPVDAPSNTDPPVLDADVHLTCCDDSGDLVIVTIEAASGFVYYGFV